MSFELVPPSIKGGNITAEVSVLLNNLINLECETKGIPVPTISWYKDGQRVISSPQALYVDRGQFLQIPRAQVSDSGQYSCRVSSTAGAAEKLFHVDVYGERQLLDCLTAPAPQLWKRFSASAVPVIKFWPLLARLCRGQI